MGLLIKLVVKERIDVCSDLEYEANQMIYSYNEHHLIKWQNEQWIEDYISTNIYLGNLIPNLALEISKNDIDELLTLCREVIKDNSKAKDLFIKLYCKYYFDIISETVLALEKLLDKFKNKKNTTFHLYTF